jgi:hypothetical protein
MSAKYPTSPQPDAPSDVAERPDRDSSVRASFHEWLKLPAVSGLECVQALRRAGFVIQSNHGGYVELYRKGLMVEVPVPLSELMTRDVLAAILQRARVGPTRFIALLDEVDDSIPPPR